ncbi:MULTISPECIES: hypothetical protein [unclassified Microbacterium]|uniref:hypothetical protein n=1 Tax=unclassified Microbacterium TaxID=2609290 RepID=UPI001ACC5478|nr:hypothetical protein [Microbacterium sp.]MBN9158848.1 hypothetical protein [Microbacterium sp.]MBS1901938.1 hypothetical protein [Actinomycetota bacterium]
MIGPRRRALLGWTAGAAMIAASAALVAVTPGPNVDPAPFVVTVAQGERGVGRNIDVTVVDVRRTQEISVPSYTKWSATGNWLVVDLKAAAVVTQSGASLSGAQFLIDGKTYTASNRPDTLFTLLQNSLVPGVPRAGAIVFELPGSLTSGTGELAFSVSSDVRADSQIRVPIDLAEVPTTDSVELPRVGWSR